MKLFFIILGIVLFAFGASLFSNYYKYKIYRKILIAVSILFVLSFYYFLSTHLFFPELFKPTKNLLVYPPTVNYYNLISNSFKNKKLYVCEYPIIKKINPYKNFFIRSTMDTNLFFLWDLSYYNKKIYFYFGITPVLLFYAPFNLITGLFLSDKLIVFILLSLILIISLSIANKLIKAITNEVVPFYIDILNIFLIGLCNCSLFLLIRTCSYEVAIASAVFFLLLSLYVLLIYLYTNKASYTSIFVIGLLIALSVGCRPHYIIFIPLLIFVIILIESIKKTDAQIIVKLILVFIVPCILYCFFLALYNYLRFDSFFEFGRTYQLNNLNQVDLHFKTQDLLTGIKHNLFLFPAINYNPTIFSFHKNELITGIIYIFPLSLFLLLFPYTEYNLWKQNKAIAIFLSVLFFIAIISLSITSIVALNQRYIFEYLCLAVLISVVMFYQLYTYTKSVVVKYMLTIFFVTLFIFSIYMNISLLFCYENSIFYKTVSDGNYEKILQFLY